MLRMITFAAMAAMMVAPTFAGDWSKTFVVRKGAQVNIKAEDATVRVVGGNDSKVVARVHTNGVDIAKDAVRVMSMHSGNTVELTISVAKKAREAAEAGSIEIEIAIPEKTKLEAKTGNGKVLAEHKNGSIEVNGNQTEKAVAADTGFTFSTRTGV